MRFRQYVSTDREACLAVFESNVPEFFLESERGEFLSGIDHENVRTYFVVEDDRGRVVACGGYLLDERNGAAWITWGMVARDQHRRGIGTFLLASRLARLWELGTVKVVHLDTTQHSRRFYERHGFVAERFVENGYGLGMHRIDLILRLTPERCRSVQLLLGAAA
jgi:GNAT superfamily N-acetyltransferase